MPKVLVWLISERAGDQMLCEMSFIFMSKVWLSWKCAGNRHTTPKELKCCAKYVLYLSQKYDRYVAPTELEYTAKCFIFIFKSMVITRLGLAYACDLYNLASLER